MLTYRVVCREGSNCSDRDATSKLAPCLLLLIVVFGVLELGVYPYSGVHFATNGRLNGCKASRVTSSDSCNTAEAPLDVVVDRKNVLHYVQLDRKII